MFVAKDNLRINILTSLWVCLIDNSILPNSENGRLRGDGRTLFPVKHKILQHIRFQIHPGEHEVERGFHLKARRRVWLLAKKSKITDYRSNASKFTSFSKFLKLKREPLQSLPNLLSFGADGSAGLPNLPNLPNLPFSEFGSQSMSVRTPSV